MTDRVSRAVVIVCVIVCMIGVYTLIAGGSATGEMTATGKVQLHKPPQFAGTLTEGGNI